MAAREDRPPTGSGPREQEPSPRDRDRDRDREWWRRSVALYLGAGLLIFTALVWLFTNRVEPVFVGASVTLLSLGVGQDALRDFQRSRDG